MRALSSFAAYMDEIAMGLMKPVAVLGAGLGTFIYLQFGAVVLLAGFPAILLLGLGFTLDRPDNSDLRSICVIYMLGVAWLLMWCFLTGILVGGVVAWAT